jgi:DNA-binding Lrp family transcriptional regulator
MNVSIDKKDSRGNEMRRMKKALKKVELKLISELMKNSRRSDRELARAIGVSQPTITRVRNRLEKMGVVKEYTMIPDFSQLGYQIMGVTLLKLKETPRKEGEMELRKAAIEVERQNPFASLLAVNGLGMQKDRMFITLYKGYDDFVRTMQLTKQLPWVNVESMESFLVDLQDKSNYRNLTMAQVSRHIQSSEESAKP